MNGTTTWRAIAALGLVGVFGVAGCSSDSKSSDPNPKVFVGKLKTTGKATIVKVVPDVAKGELECDTPKLDAAKKIATYSCTAATTKGGEVTLVGSSTYEQLKRKTKGAFEGTIVIAVDGKEVLKTDCVGKACPSK